MQHSFQDTLADATNVAEERISNIRTVKSFSQEAAEVNRYASKIQAVFELAKRESLARGIFFGMVTLLNYDLLIILFLMGKKLLNHHSTSLFFRPVSAEM